MTYPVKQINDFAKDLEQLGTKEKFWFPYSDGQSEQLWLFKYSWAETGEHWSEKCAAEICHLLGIPHAPYELAISNGRVGVITPNIIPNGHRMVMGNEVLHANSNEYPRPQPKVDDEQIVRVREHTVKRVLGCLDQDHFRPPVSEYPLDGLNAGDVFCGYLLLDALISNQDRHHENWAIILNGETNECFLCPTYDHAASLGRELKETECTERLSTRDKNRSIPHFVRKARSELFRSKTDKKPMLTAEAFYLSVEKRPNAKQHWLGKLAALSDDAIRDVFHQVDGTCITEAARDFAVMMVLENKKRLLENDNA